MAKKQTSKRRKTSAKQRAAQNRMRRAAKTCAGRKLNAFRSCMRRELKK